MGEWSTNSRSLGEGLKAIPVDTSDTDMVYRFKISGCSAVG
jgi:hypothetical protein